MNENRAQMAEQKKGMLVFLVYFWKIRPKTE